MPFTKITETDLQNKGVIGLPDTPGLSTTEMQEKFDEIALDVLAPKHNGLVDELNAASAAGNMGALNTGGTASNVQAELDNRYTISVTEQLLNNKVDAEEGKGLTSNDFTDAYKFKLNNIEDNANNYVLPKGTQSTLGGVMGDGTTFTIDEDGYGHAVGGGGGGTSDYTALINKPKLNDITITGSHDSEYYGLLRPYIVVTSEAGSTVTISKGGETITATQISGSTTTWEVCPTSYGTWTVSSDLPGADIATSTITIDAVKTYAITVEHITSTITVTYESGATCTCSKGSTVYTATSNPQTFTVRSIGNWVVAVTYDGLTKTVTVPITADEQFESVTVEFADIEVTYGNAFRGTTITCANGDTVYSKTAPSNANTVNFTIPTTGTWRVSGTVGSDTYNQDVVVSAMTSYSATLQVFNATVTVTFPYTEGASCTLSDGTTTLTATTSPMAFSVPNVGTWTATCTLDSQAKTDSVTITTDGQTESLTFSYGTINLTYDNEFRGLSITCTDSNSTITKTAPISGNSMSFYPPNTGTWTISGVYSSVTYTATATVSSLSTAVTAQLILIPNGSTVTPTDDIQKWLNCAGIFDKTSYTALSDILGDSVTFNALLGDSNANAYLARSTTFATTLCASQYAMNLIGQYDVCCDALLGNSTWASAITNSAYVDYVLNVSVPTITAPSAYVFADGYTGSYYPYKVFDNDTTTYWEKYNSGGTVYPCYVGYMFGESVVIKCLKICSRGASDSRVKNFILQGSNDTTNGSDGTWVDVYTGINNGNTKEERESYNTYVTDNDTAYSSYRLYIIDTYDTSYVKYCDVSSLQFYGRTATSEYIHGANNEVAYYLDGATQVPISNPSTLDAGTYTFGSTVAKNPDSLATDYTKSIRITPNTVEVVLRPDNALYWWGYESANSLTADGYSLYGTAITSATKNNYDIQLPQGGSTYVGIGTTNTFNTTGVTKIKAIGNTSGNNLTIGLFASKTITGAADYGSVDFGSAGLICVEGNATSNVNTYMLLFRGNPSTQYGLIYALWYE